MADNQHVDKPCFRAEHDSQQDLMKQGPVELPYPTERLERENAVSRAARKTVKPLSHERL